MKRTIPPEREQRVKEYFKSTSKLPEFPKKSPNMEKHFYFPKIIGRFSNDALNVYTVLCSVADFEKDNWFSIQKPDIARRAGLLIPTVNSALIELKNARLINQRLDSEGRMHYYSYRVQFVRKQMISEMKKQSFIFHTCIVDSGIWKKLSARAKALYLALRSNAIFDWYLYADVEQINHEDMPNIYESEVYRNRKWDVCDLTLTELCQSVGIQRTNIKKVIHQLKTYELIELVDGRYLVYLKPRIK